MAIVSYADSSNQASFYMAWYRELMIERLATGRWNRLVGWGMLCTGLGMAATLDPWLLVPASDSILTSVRWAWRHLLGVMLAMAFLQLAVAHLCATAAFPVTARRMVALLTLAGVLVYVAGYTVGEQGGGLVLLGSACNLVGFGYLLWGAPRGQYAIPIRMILPVACFGMALDFGSGLLMILPETWGVDYLGDEDGIRLRMLRLARVAAIALSVLTLLFFGLVGRERARELEEGEVSKEAGILRGGYFLAGGAMGMPAVLTAACFSSLTIKYLLPLPATAVCFGVSCGLLLAVRSCRPLEIWGWLLIVVSTWVGMLMGLYAFDGPLVPPGFLGEYANLSRGISRMAHSYSIVFGMLAIFLSWESKHGEPRAAGARVASMLVAIGSMLTLVVLCVHLVSRLPAWTLGLGPTCTLLGALVCLLLPSLRVRRESQGELI